MGNKPHNIFESSYRLFYGKLFSALASQFGLGYVNQIEDAIQNAFLKSLKIWKPNQMPDNKENWLYIVARNDVINQIQKATKVTSESIIATVDENETVESDLRLQTILLFSSSTRISTQTKVVFILKNIFGLSVREIAVSTLLSQDAIYKSIKRAKKNLQLEFANQPIVEFPGKATQKEVSIVEEILYAVFNIGFDSFDEKIQSIVNDDLCLEALSLVRLLFEKYKYNSTRNLLALFCFHIARIPAKVNNGKLVSFFRQDKTQWDKKLINLAFYYLQKPGQMNKFYIEALIVSKYMTANLYDVEHWNDVVKLYRLLANIDNSPIVKLNLCYALHKAKQEGEALELLDKIEKEFPDKHVYFSLVKADILRKMDSKQSEKIMETVLNQIDQTIRKEYLLEKGIINF
nr:sigma-70 family RNA polymerase sigma factor [uncultured Draconibacterium sp.]